MPVKKRILLADDKLVHRSFVRSNIRDAAKNMGIELEIVAEAEDGAQLVELYKQHSTQPIDVVLADIRMPNLDGLSALVKIMDMNKRQRMIMVSSEDMATVSKLGAAGDSQKDADLKQKMDLLNKTADRLRKGLVEEGKINSILTGCEKLALDPIWVAEQYGACGYMRKPYDQAKTLEMLTHGFSNIVTKFLAKI